MLKKNQILSALLCMFASMSPSLKAQSSDLIVGSNTSGNTTNFIAGSGTDNFYSNTYVGFNTNASSNRLGVFNAGTLLTNSENIYIGNNGSHNSLVISNGGTVASVVGYVGGQAVSSNNLVQVVDAHSSWNNSGDFYVGKSGWGNTMVISNGAVVNDGRAYIGGNASASNNLVQITGVGSRWSNNTFLNIGADGASNSMIISDGAVV